MEYDIFVSDSYKKSALSRTDHCTWYLSTAFIEKYDLTIRPAKRQILLGGGTVYLYGSDSNLSSHSTIRHAYDLRVAVERTTVWPGEYVEVSIPTDMSSLDGSFALKYMLMLPAYNMRSRHGFGHPLVSFPKLTNAPRGLKKNEQFCQIRRVASLTVSKSDSGSNVHTQNTPPTVAFYSE